MFSGIAAALGGGLLLAMTQLAAAECECGYSINKTSDANFAVFSEVMENDFLHTYLANADIEDSGWRAQTYNVTVPPKKMPDNSTLELFDKHFTMENIELNPLKDHAAWSGDSTNGGDSGLRLWVGGDSSQGFVTGAELSSSREDFIYGSYRVGMKLAETNGTCGAFYFFVSNAMEIDLEFLNTEFTEDNGGGLVNLVLQTPESAELADASALPTFRRQPLPFKPDGMFHEYRFDWTPDKVEFLVDGELVWTMSQGVPNKAGHLLFNHWSNGDPFWSAGPPKADTAMTISYMKAYFNSTDPERKTVNDKKCKVFDPSKVCEIPAQRVAPNGNNSETYFFTQESNKAPDQVNFNSGASSFFGSSTSLSTFIPLLAALFSWTLSL